MAENTGNSTGEGRIIYPLSTPEFHAALLPVLDEETIRCSSPIIPHDVYGNHYVVLPRGFPLNDKSVAYVGDLLKYMNPHQLRYILKLTDGLLKKAETEKRADAAAGTKKPNAAAGLKKPDAAAGAKDVDATMRDA